MALSLVNTYSVPLQLSFEPEILKSKVFTVTSYAIDVMFFIDILISLRTVYVDDKGEEETRSYYMAREYLKSTFIIDFLATFPFDLVVDAVGV